MTVLPDSIFISRPSAIDAGRLFYSERLEEERRWEKWYRGDLTSLLSKKTYSGSGLENLDPVALVDSSLFNIAADWYADTIASELPSITFQGAERDTSGTGRFINGGSWWTENQRVIWPILLRGIRQCSIYWRACFLLTSQGLQATPSYNIVPIVMPFDREQIEGYVILQPAPAYAGQLEIFKDGLPYNFILVTRYLPNGWVEIDPDTGNLTRFPPTIDQATFSGTGSGSTMHITEQVSPWRPADVEGVWVTEPIEPFFPSMADPALSYYIVMSQLRSFAMRFTDPLLSTYQLVDRADKNSLAQPGAKVIEILDTQDHPAYIQPMEPSGLRELAAMHRQDALTAAGINDAALGIQGLWQESGISRRMQMTNALSRIKRVRESIATILPDILIAMGAPSRPEVTWNSTPLETIDAKARSAAETYEAGGMTRNEFRQAIGLPAIEGEDNFIPQPQHTGRAMDQTRN